MEKWKPLEVDLVCGLFQDTLRQSSILEDFMPAIFFFGGGGRWRDNEGVPITFDQDRSVRELLPSFLR